MKVKNDSKSKKVSDLRPVSVPPGNPRAEIDVLRDQISRLISQHPDKAVTILSDWIKRASQKTPKKAG